MKQFLKYFQNTEFHMLWTVLDNKSKITPSCVVVLYLLVAGGLFWKYDLSIMGLIVFFSITIVVVLLLVGSLRRTKKERGKTWVVIYAAPIGGDTTMIDYVIACEALREGVQPTSGSPYMLSTTSLPSETENFWHNEVKKLDEKVDDLLQLMSTTKEMRVSLFAIAPMPLLVYLGTRLNEKYQVDVYQLNRNTQRWDWPEETGEKFIVHRPQRMNNRPVLVFSISDSIIDRIRTLYGSEASIWEVTVSKPDVDILRSEEQLSEFRDLVRDLLSEISGATDEPEINVHMAMPIACAIELGRVWMPKAHSPLALFDYERKSENKVLTIK